MKLDELDPWSMLRHVFCRMFCPCHHDGRKPVPRVRVTIAVGSIAVQFFGDFKMQLPDDKTASAKANFVDAKGNPAKVDGAPVYSTDRTDILTITDNGDGTATIAPAGPLGTAQVTCTADADLGAGVQNVVLLGEIEVIAGTAVAGTIDFAVNP